MVDHYTAQAWAHVAEVRDRFAALQPVYDAVIDRFGGLTADVAPGLSLRHEVVILGSDYPGSLEGANDHRSAGLARR